MPASSSARCSTISSAWRANTASASSTASRCRSTGRLLYWLGDILVYGPLKNVLGFSRVRVAYTAGEAIGPDLFAFYRSIGLNLKQLYGQTEAFLYVTAQPDGEIYSDTVGPACPNVDIRIAENGEVQFKSPGMFAGYFKDEAKTAEAMTPDGYVKTGDAGLLRREDRPSENHRPRQGRRQAQRRHAVPAEIHREQAQVLSQYPRGGGLWRQARFRRGDDQYRSHRGRKLGRAQQRGLRLLSGARRPSAGLRHDREARRRGEPLARRGQGDGGRADQALPHPAQGTRRRRRRAHAHPEGAPRLHRRALRAADQGAL